MQTGYRQKIKERKCTVIIKYYEPTNQIRGKDCNKSIFQSRKLFAKKTTICVGKVIEYIVWGL